MSEFAAPVNPPNPITGQRLWHVAQGAGVVATVALLVALVRWPTPTLNILWNAVIPVLPAVFLINPLLWRNVCPLATLTTLTGDRVGTRTIGGEAVRHTLVVGVVLLVVLVSARRVVFNTDGAVLAAVIVLVAVLALAGGTLFERKAGFCNSICPVQPVERLYGQSPLWTLPNSRCPTCIGCTVQGCLDRSLAEAMRTAIGPRAATTSWLHSPFGYFAAAFPGFITGYFLVGNQPLAAAPRVALVISAAMAASLAVVAAVVRLLQLTAAVAMPLLGALAVGIYYWFSGPSIAAAWQLSAVASWLIRVAALLLVGTWLLRALRGPRSLSLDSRHSGAAAARNT